MNWLLPPPPPPLRQQAVFHSQSSCLSSVELTDRRVDGRGWGRSQIIGRRESLVLYITLNTLWSSVCTVGVSNNSAVPTANVTLLALLCRYVLQYINHAASRENYSSNKRWRPKQGLVVRDWAQIIIFWLCMCFGWLKREKGGMLGWVCNCVYVRDYVKFTLCILSTSGCLYSSLLLKRHPAVPPLYRVSPSFSVKSQSFAYICI